jgi:hypothetical protein
MSLLLMLGPLLSTPMGSVKSIPDDRNFEERRLLIETVGYAIGRGSLSRLDSRVHKASIVRLAKTMVSLGWS